MPGADAAAGAADRADAAAEDVCSDPATVELRWLSGRVQRLPCSPDETFADLALRARRAAGARPPLRVAGRGLALDGRERVADHLPQSEPFAVVAAPTRLGVPAGLHHEALRVSEDRMAVTCHSASPEFHGCFLSAPLEPRGVHVLRVQIVGPRRLMFVGITRSDARDWYYLPTLGVHQDDSVLHGMFDNLFGADIQCRREAVDLAFRRGVLTMAVDTCEGRVAVLDAELREIGFAFAPGLANERICFSASLFGRAADCGATTLRVLQDDCPTALQIPAGPAASACPDAPGDGSDADSEEGSESAWRPAQQLG